MSTSIYAEYYCNLCNSPATHLSNKKKYWCSKNPRSSPGVKEIRKQKSLEKFGTDNPSKSKEIKDKISVINSGLSQQAKIQRQDTCLEKYGVKTVMQVEQFRNNCSTSHLSRSQADVNTSIALRKETCLEKYGVESVGQDKSTRRKIKETHIRKYGKMFNNRIQAVETCIEKYGVENPSQDPKVIIKIRKNQYKTKSFIFPSGKEVLVQGYEPKALTDLLKIYTEEEIITETNSIPRIEYVGIDNKTHYYFPDIYIPKDNLIVEVKSEWTYNQDLTTVLLKEKATRNSGFNYRFMIY